MRPLFEKTKIISFNEKSQSEPCCYRSLVISQRFLFLSYGLIFLNVWIYIASEFSSLKSGVNSRITYSSVLMDQTRFCSSNTYIMSFLGEKEASIIFLGAEMTLQNFGSKSYYSPSISVTSSIYLISFSKITASLEESFQVIFLKGLNAFPSISCLSNILCTTLFVFYSVSSLQTQRMPSVENDAN